MRAVFALFVIAVMLLGALDHVAEGKTYTGIDTAHGVAHQDVHSGGAGDDEECAKPHGCHAADLAAFWSIPSFGLAAALLLPAFGVRAKSFAERLDLLATPPPR